MRIHLISLVILAFACVKKSEIPENIISKQDMSTLMVDIHLLESKVSNLNLPTDSAMQVYRKFEKEIFEKHDTDSLQYAESVRFYSMNPELYHDIYEIVVDTLIVREKSKTFY
jgi:hypothetical protein